ncbi:MAG TPA: zinc-ribbon domain-containing protein [Terriglobales bacterium]|nr:zinc-ribbon domain-containing protein [Terriglobales bacterium]
MFCPDCGHRNPDDNRFCGQCGERLPDRNRREPANRSAASPAATPLHEDKPGVTRSSAPPETFTEAPAGTMYSAAARDERRVEAWRNEPREPVRRDARIEPTSSSSFLGLGSAEYEKPEREISWRFWALMLLIIGVAVLFGLQWRASKLRAEQQQPKPAATQATPTTDDNQATTPPKDESAVPSPTPEQGRPNEAQPPAKDKGAKPPKGADAKPESKNDTGGDAADGGDAAQSKQDEPPQSPKQIAKTETRAVAPREFSDAPVQSADHLIAGGACNDAVRVLKDAGDNPRAMTKLGAMYLTGTCVGPDRVMAYTWFSQAFQADPHNLRLENTRRMIWSQMTEDERARIESGASAR